MLHDILLSLSGYRSEIWEKVKAQDGDNESLRDFTSEPERAMLEVLETLSNLHLQIKDEACKISTSHNSVICRAVASSILDHHLSVFRKKVLEIEASILQRDAGYVGGYQIVPLSTIVADFAPWTRRLQWLLSICSFAESAKQGHPSTSSCTGKEMLDHLGHEIHTGYSDIEDMASNLLVCGQRVWMRSAAAWILYGRLPSLGAADFLVQPRDEVDVTFEKYTIDHELRPSFLSRDAAEFILAIGNAIVQTQVNSNKGMTNLQTAASQPLNLMSQHLRALESLSYPLQQSALETTMREIDESISQNTLASLLPYERIAGVLDVIYRFVLLTNGEFATSLIQHAATKVSSRSQTEVASKPVRKLGRLDNLTMQAAELSSILRSVLDELASLQLDQIMDDEAFIVARKTLALHGQPQAKDSAPLPSILPGGAVLGLSLDYDPTLKLFLQPSDLSRYSAINAYLLSIRRAELHLSSLWKLTPHRRWYPQPLGPPHSATKRGQEMLALRRARELSRGSIMRRHWATASKALFIINELDSYLHSEVIRNSWLQFQNWLGGGPVRTRPGTSRSQGSRPGSAGSSKAGNQAMTSEGRSRHINDPRTLAKAHRTYLEALYNGLLLSNKRYVQALQDLTNLVDHYIALFSRLQTIWEGLDLQEDDGVVDAFSNYAEDEKSVLAELSRSQGLMEEALGALVDRLEEAEKSRVLDEMISSVVLADVDSRKFVPWKSRTMDRLMMKLDFLTSERKEEEDDVVKRLDDDD